MAPYLRDMPGFKILEEFSRGFQETGRVSLRLAERDRVNEQYLLSIGVSPSVGQAHHRPAVFQGMGPESSLLAQLCAFSQEQERLNIATEWRLKVLTR